LEGISERIDFKMWISLLWRIPRNELLLGLLFLFEIKLKFREIEVGMN